MSSFEIAVVAAYGLVLLVLSVYGSHRYRMAFLYYRHKYKLPTPKGTMAALPRVTVQLPIFNELYVVERLIDSVCRIDYPRDLFEMQVLDDSTDETQGIARARVEQWKQQGVDVVYIHRVDRTGFKAGALENGLHQAKGEFVAVFDADFVPAPDFLKRTVPFFVDPKVGMVQVRWGHLNREFSILTQAQSLLLDGHFIIEHTARNRSGCFFNFNGTAGIWRRGTITDAGGWQHDTLTEDLDLSYRAQIKGWQFIFLPEIISPAEVPVDMNAFKSQQHRWAKGSIQTAKKLLPKILRSDLPYAVKREAFFHLSNNVAHLLMVLVSLLMPLSMVVRFSHGSIHAVAHLPFFVTATCVCFFYVASQRESSRRHLVAHQVPALPDDPGHRSRDQQRQGGGRGAARPGDRLHPHAEDGQRGPVATAPKRCYRVAEEPAAPAGARASAPTSRGPWSRHRPRRLVLAALPDPLPGWVPLRRADERDRGAPRLLGPLRSRAAAGRRRGVIGVAAAALQQLLVQGIAGPEAFHRLETIRSQNALAPSFSPVTERRRARNPSWRSACSRPAAASRPSPLP